MTDIDYEIAKKLKQKFNEQVPLIEMRIFGSRARGDNDLDSDMDVFIEIGQYTHEIEDVLRNISWEIGLEYMVHVSPHIFSKYDIEESPLRVSPILSNIRDEGVLI